MPSQQHEARIQLVREQPELAAQLLRHDAKVMIPDYDNTRLESVDLTEAQPVEYRADAAVSLLRQGETTPVLGIVVEVQLQIDERKRYTWPVYVTTLRARLNCPVVLLVLTDNEVVARWASQPIDLGGASRIVPVVVGPSEVPQVTDEEQGRSHPQLAVLSAMTHGRDIDVRKAARIANIAWQAIAGLDEDQSSIYLDLIMASLSEAASREFSVMMPPDYEFNNEFAKASFAKGEAWGQERGCVRMVMRQLTLRFGPLTDDIRVRISRMSVAQIDAVGEQLLTAKSLQEVLDRTS